MLPQDTICDKPYFFILCHFNLWLRIKINNQEFRAIVLKNNNTALFFSHFGNLREILVCFSRCKNSIGIKSHNIISIFSIP